MGSQQEEEQWFQSSTNSRNLIKCGPNMTILDTLIPQLCPEARGGPKTAQLPKQTSLGRECIKSHKNGSSWSFSNTSDFDVALGFMSPQKRVCRVASCQPLYGVYCSILYYLVKKLCSKDYMQVRTYMIVVIFNWEPAL